ncbi:hypothetical protein QBC36DRAFT_371771 [Triangularia setosa]|uniref:Uncharacterized protein n=1 Tax=Triangularia setosa TaxID=2587417 RepID=A0AAN6W8L4_9PEZI|nr:hypothetical protein QBC36DRAFT_371771 [Podospora setosa]
MVSFRNLITGALAVATPAIAALTPAQIVTALRDLTTKSQALQTPAQQITIINGPLIIIGLGPFPQIIKGFTEIITITTATVPQIVDTPTITVVADRQAIAEAFRDFVRVHQALLNILIGKSGLFSTVPIIGQPVAATLRSLESIVDAAAFALIDVVAGQEGVPAQAQALSTTIDIAIKKYEGLSLTKRENVIPVAAIKAAPIGRRAEMIAA